MCSVNDCVLLICQVKNPPLPHCQWSGRPWKARKPGSLNFVADDGRNNHISAKRLTTGAALRKRKYPTTRGSQGCCCHGELIYNTYSRLCLLPQVYLFLILHGHTRTAWNSMVTRTVVYSTGAVRRDHTNGSVNYMDHRPSAAVE